MPLYAYRCPVCPNKEEHWASVAERHTAAPYCCAGDHLGSHGQMKLEIMPTHVMPDIAPYKAVAGDMAGQHITSRREHREFLKRNRFVEVGNEPVKPVKNDTRPKKGEVAAELKKVIPQVLAKYRT